MAVFSEKDKLYFLGVPQDRVYKLSLVLRDWALNCLLWFKQGHGFVLMATVLTIAEGNTIFSKYHIFLKNYWHVNKIINRQMHRCYYFQLPVLFFWVISLFWQPFLSVPCAPWWCVLTLTTTVVLPPEIALTFTRGPGERAELNAQGWIANSKMGTSVREGFRVNGYAGFSVSRLWKWFLFWIWSKLAHVKLIY